MMRSEKYVLVICDDRESSQVVDAQLKFIGEDAICLKSDETSTFYDVDSRKAQVYCVIYTDLQQPSYSAQIEFIHNQFPELLHIIVDSHDVKQELEKLNASGINKENVIQLTIENFNSRNLQKYLFHGLEKDSVQVAEIDEKTNESKVVSETGTALFRCLVGESEKIKNVIATIDQVVNKDITVLIKGESGTGKEVVARNIHYHSGRSNSHFSIVQCATLKEDSFNKEFFGQSSTETGVRSTNGYVGDAEGGTLFLDEVGDLPFHIQSRLLRFIEDKIYEQIGSKQTLKADVRIIAATNQDLHEKIRSGEFREDLFYRLNVMPIELPPLRDHTEDIPELVDELISRLENTDNISIRFNNAALISLQRHSWDGNVRELGNLVERLSILIPDKVLGVADLPIEYQHVSAEEIHQIESLADSENNLYQPPATEETKENAEGSEDVESTEEGKENKSQSRMLSPLNTEALQKFLENFEKNLVQVALADSDGMVEFASERLAISEQELKDKILRFEIH